MHFWHILVFNRLAHHQISLLNWHLNDMRIKKCSLEHMSWKNFHQPKFLEKNFDLWNICVEVRINHLHNSTSLYLVQWQDFSYYCIRTQWRGIFCYWIRMVKIKTLFLAQTHIILERCSDRPYSIRGNVIITWYIPIRVLLVV